MDAATYKALRIHLGRQKEVAAELGVTRTTLAHREGGRNAISTEASLALEALVRRKAGGDVSPPAPADINLRLS